MCRLAEGFMGGLSTGACTVQSLHNLTVCCPHLALISVQKFGYTKCGWWCNWPWHLQIQVGRCAGTETHEVKLYLGEAEPEVLRRCKRLAAEGLGYPVNKNGTIMHHGGR